VVLEVFADRKRARIQHIDYGTTDEVSFADVRRVPASFFAMPAKGCRARMHGGLRVFASVYRERVAGRYAAAKGTAPCIVYRH